MTVDIFSRVEPGRLLHCIVRGRVDLPEEGRHELIAPHNSIQCAFLTMHKGITFRPHQHIWKKGPENIKAQESWVVISGRVLVSLFDTDGALLAKEELGPGDASFTLHGGHTYFILEDDTVVYEYKTGPYTGQHNDKVFLCP